MRKNSGSSAILPFGRAGAVAFRVLASTLMLLVFCALLAGCSNSAQSETAVLYIVDGELSALPADYYDNSPAFRPDPSETVHEVGGYTLTIPDRFHAPGESERFLLADYYVDYDGAPNFTAMLSITDKPLNGYYAQEPPAGFTERCTENELGVTTVTVLSIEGHLGADEAVVPWVGYQFTCDDVVYNRISYTLGDEYVVLSSYEDTELRELIEDALVQALENP